MKTDNLNSSGFFSKFMDYTAPERASLLNKSEPGKALLQFINNLSSAEKKDDQNIIDKENFDSINKNNKDTLSRFFSIGADLIALEMASLSPEKQEIFNHSENLFKENPSSLEREKMERAVWKTFFPEALIAEEQDTLNSLDQRAERLRAKRVIKIDQLNPNPIQSVSEELIFTSNVLITLPTQDYPYEGLGFSNHLKNKLKAINRDDQSYWFDHPILLGTPPEGNELLYGLQGLSNTLAYEKEHKTVLADARLTVILSVSVTHNGLKEIAREYIEDEVKKSTGINNLDVYVFTEDDTEALASALITEEKNSLAAVKEVFGVDGEYGRHYTFLKAIAPLWHTAVDNKIKGTFKIDLDQIFPHKELVAETGKSAFEHFASPLWGATGTDTSGRKVELGMIAGALVNESDISKSIYTPDVTFADSAPEGEDLFFNKRFVMALSTQAELLTRYTKNSPIDGKTNALSRIHVTGGTNGILVDALRKYRPFTPTFIGRAEDQSFILSVLFKEIQCKDDQGSLLRYAHEDGLIMRHDKEAFAGEAIKAAKLGSYTGDLLRTLLFTFYADALGVEQNKIKNEIDPFTGCFVTSIPFTNIYLRLALRALDSYKTDSTQGDALIHMAAQRLLPVIEKFKQGNFLKDQFEKERKGWDTYYNAIDKLEQGLNNNESSADKKRKSLSSILMNCKLGHI